MIYICTPYSHVDPAVREERFRTACRFASALMKQGHMVYCPVAHSHPIAIEGGLPTDWAFWREYDLWYLERVDRIIVLKLPGWEESVGLRAEVQIATEFGLPVEWVEP